MRCLCCNRNLSDLESTRRHADTGDFLDICNRCLRDIDIPYTERSDLTDVLEDDEDVEDLDNSLSEVSSDGEGYEGE